MSISLLMLAFSPVEMILLAALFLLMVSAIVLAFAGFFGGVR